MPTGLLVQVFDGGMDPRRTRRECRPWRNRRDDARQRPARSDRAAPGAQRRSRHGPARPDVSVDGQAMPVLIADVKPGGPVTLVLDAKSGRILRATIRTGIERRKSRRRFPTTVT